MMLSSKELQTTLDQLLTVHDICDMFRITQMTVYTWRKDRSFPTIEIKGGPRENVRASVRFHPEDVAVWAKREGIRGKTLSTKTYHKRVRVAA